MAPHKLFINSRWEDSACNRHVDVINPATGEPITTVPDADADDVDRAVKAARASFEKKSWRGMDPSKRERILWNIADLIDKHRDELASIISSENGKTVREAVGADVAPAADCFRYYAGWVRKIYGETIPVDGPFFNYTVREPVGVVGAIVPWNFPLQIAAWKVAPALACGCSVVLKPSELTPLNALKLAEIAHEAGLPEGVLNVVTGYGQTTGEALALHEDVDKISFTGSIAHRAQAGAEFGRVEPEAPEPGTGRQVSQHHFPGCRPGRRDEGRLLGHFRRQGRGVQRRLAPAGARRHLRPVCGRPGGPRAQIAAGQSAGPGHADGLADLLAPDGPDSRLHRAGQAGRGQAGGRRRAGYRGRQGQGLFRQAHSLRRCEARDEDRAAKRFSARW